MDSPVGKDRYHHRSKLLERILPHAFEQFRACDVADRRALRFLLLLRRVIQRVAQENVGIPLVTRVAGHNRIERFGESYLLHVVVPLLPGAPMITNNRDTGNSPLSEQSARQRIDPFLL
jgi:hypothetical protein